MGKKRHKPGVGTTYKGIVKTEGHDFIKDRIAFAVDVSTVEELADAIAFELEKGQKAKRAISGEPFKIQFFDPEWGEYRDLQTLKPLSFDGCNGQLRLVLPDHSEPVKTKADWANKKIVFVRKDSYRPDPRAIAYKARSSDILAKHEWDRRSERYGDTLSTATGRRHPNGVGRAGAPRGSLTNEVIMDFRGRDNNTDGVVTEQAGAFLWRYRPKTLRNSCVDLARRGIRCLCPCFFRSIRPLTAHVYAHAGEYAEVLHCIKAGMDVNERDAHGRTILNIAVMEEHVEIVDLLINAGADVNGQDANSLLSPLHHSIAQGKDRLADRFICAGADMNIRDATGMTPLMLAAQEGHLDIVAMIVQEAIYPEDETRRGIEVVDVRDNTGWTPLHYAAHKGQVEVAEYLLEEGDANQHMKDKAGCTASMIALQEGHGDVCSYLDSHNSHVHNKYDEAVGS